MSDLESHLRCAHKQLRLAAGKSDNPVQRAQLLELADDTESAGAFEPAMAAPVAFVRASELPVREGATDD